MEKLIKKIILILLIITGCSSDNDEKAPSIILIKLVDAPGDFERVNIEVKDIEIDRGNGLKSLGNITPKVYDILTLTGGVQALLVEKQIPAGKVTQIRLVLGENNSVVKNGKTIKIITSDAEQSGLTLKVNQELISGKKHTLILDFDVAKSIVAKGNGLYSLNPFIRLSSEELHGAIFGVVNPNTHQVGIKASSKTDTISTHINKNGKFVLYGVPKGTYKIVFTADTITKLTPKILKNIEVINGRNINLDTINLK